MRLIDVDALKKAIEQGEGFSWDNHGKDDLCVRKKYIDNAPTVETNCENCPFKKFTEDMTDKLAKVMIDNGITDFDEFAKACGVSYLHQDSITKSDTEI